MPDRKLLPQPFRVVSVVASQYAGGIGPVCQYAAEGLIRQYGWQVTLLCLHDPEADLMDADSGLRIVSLGLDSDYSIRFLTWLEDHPQDLMISSDVSYIEPAFGYLPKSTRHIVHIHDCIRRYQQIAARNARFIDGVICVGRHIQQPLGKSLEQAEFRGLLKTVHNGANFPSMMQRNSSKEVLNLLFMGRLDPLKGISDLAPILRILQRKQVPVKLTIAGGYSDQLKADFEYLGVSTLVLWVGRVSHRECYELASKNDVFLMTSRKEPFGMVTIEAMSMGCVPLAYDIPSGSSEIIEHDDSGLLIPLGSFKSWADALERLHRDRAELQRLSDGAVQRARTAFSSEVMSKNLGDVCMAVYTARTTSGVERLPGLPPATAAQSACTTSMYQRLPEGLRSWLRYKIFSYPRLSYWLSSR